MSPSYEPELVANLERAEESIRAAKLLLGAGHFDFAASRAYYAAFYAATLLEFLARVPLTDYTGLSGCGSRDRSRHQHKEPSKLAWVLTTRIFFGYSVKECLLTFSVRDTPMYLEDCDQRAL